jgi:NADH dehydrogenase [ubiquinone] 1 alpha subcomplex assembly factor 7
MNELLKKLKKRIANNGPLSLAEYMSISLVEPEYGYYMSGDPLGKKGDFVTAPEVSQIFGELIGLWCAIVWHKMGSPNKIKIIELGPGRGTLMVDALRALKLAPTFLDAIEIHLVEVSPALRKRQERNLKSLGFDFYWHNKFEDVPKGAFILLANEFLDALPVQQFEKSNVGWVERKITFGRTDELVWELDKFSERISVPIPPNLMLSPVGSIFEYSEVALKLVTVVTESVLKYEGAALFIDYGYTKSAIGDTLQAVKNHKYHDPLSNPGYIDLTTHVNFEMLARSAREAGGQVYGPVNQRDFLRPLGIEHRAKQLLKTASTRQKGDILESLKRLISLDQMGGLFKALAIGHIKHPVPEGFENRRGMK